MSKKRNYWLLKSEPTTYSLANLKNEEKTAWSGVRNYQARNFMRDDMKNGDRILFYHSNTNPPRIVGEGEVVGAPYPDPTQFNVKSTYYDPKATKKNPRWFCVTISFAKEFKKPVLLKTLKSSARFSDMLLTQKGSRLSVQPVASHHYKAVLRLGGEEEIDRT